MQVDVNGALRVCVFIEAEKVLSSGKVKCRTTAKSLRQGLVQGPHVSLLRRAVDADQKEQERLVMTYLALGPLLDQEACAYLEQGRAQTEMIGDSAIEIGVEGETFLQAHRGRLHKG
ncbi:hypothetical protein D3C76_1058580 [compost metagenome]